MFKKKNEDGNIDYDNDFKVIIAGNSAENNQLKVHQPQHSLKSLESFSKSSESLALPVTPLECKKQEKEKSKKKSRSATRSCSRNESKSSQIEDTLDSTVSRDQGESYMSQIMRNLNKDSRKSIGDNEEERLRLMNIRLEKQVSELSQKNEEILFDRSQIKCELETTKQQSEDNKSQVDVLEEEFESIRRNRNNDHKKINELENLVSIKEAEVEKKSFHLSQISNEMGQYQNDLQENKEKMRLIVEELDAKNYVISDLKKKISEFHSQLELMKLYQENSEYQAEQLQLELTNSKNARNHLDEQRKRTEEAKDKLQGEFYRITNCLLESRHENEAIRQKYKSVELKLAKFQEIKLHETKALLFELEQLQKEIMTNEVEKRELENQYSDILRKCNDKIYELESEQETNRRMVEKAKELSLELEDAKTQFAEAEKNINALEMEAAELRKKLVLTEDSLNQKINDLKIIEDENRELEANLRELNESSAEKEMTISSLGEELRNLKAAFDRANDERNQACEGIEKLREEIGQVEDQFEQSRKNMTEKEQTVKRLEEINEELKKNLAKELEECALKDRNLTVLKSENNQLLESRELFQQNNLEILNELEILRGNLNSANMKIAGLEDELMGMKTENSELNKLIFQWQSDADSYKADLMETREKLENLIHIQEMYAKLFEDHERLEKGYNELHGQHRSMTEEYKQETGQLRTRLEEREDELQRLVSMKEEVIVTVQKDLHAVDQNNRDLKNELENIKFNHTIEMANKEEQFRERLEQSKKEFSDMCQEKIRCEGAIESLQGHIKSVIEKHENKLKEYKSKMLHLEQQSTEYADFEKERLALLAKLEQKKGELAALIIINKNMKDRTEVIENTLAQKEANICRLKSKFEDALAKKEDQIRSLNEKLNYQCNTLKTEENIKKDFIGQLEERVTLIDQLRRKVDNSEGTRLDLQSEINKMKSDCQVTLHENQLLKDSHVTLTKDLERKIQENDELSRINQQLLERIDRTSFEKERTERAVSELRTEIDNKCSEMRTFETMQKDVTRQSKKVIEEMGNILKDVTEQNDCLTRKVELSHQQEIIMSAIMNQIKSELKRIIFQQEVQRGMETSVTLTREQLQELGKLVSVIEEPTLSFRPQSRLSKCIDDLRTQIDSIQSEISKQLEEQVPQTETEVYE